MYSIHFFDMKDVHREIGSWAIRQKVEWWCVGDHSDINDAKVVIVRGPSGHLVGFCIISNCQETPATLFYLMVAKRHRKKGLCRRMLDKALEVFPSLVGTCRKDMVGMWTHLGAMAEEKKCHVKGVYSIRWPKNAYTAPCV